MEDLIIPIKLVCSITGKIKLFTNRSYVEKKIKEFGSLKKLKQEYVCREAKALLKQDKSVEEIGKLLNPDVVAITIGSKKLIEEVGSNDPCMNPNWYSKGRSCKLCAFFKLCTHSLKKVVV